MSSRLAAMVRKEFSQLLRDRPILFFVLWAFTGSVYTGGHGISTEIHNYPIVVLDLSRSRESRELLSRFQAPYFKLMGYARSDAEVVTMLDTGQASLAVVIPPDFERRLHRTGARFQVISDGSHATAATIAGAHIASIANGYSVELLEQRWGSGEAGPRRVPQVDARIRVEYNPNLLEQWFASLLEVLNHTTLIAMLLAAAAMVREREHGTVEHLLVSPLRPAELFAAKIIPTVALVPLAALASVFGIVHGVFETPIRGSVALFYAVSVIYVFAMASLGLAIAVVARNLGQAMLMLLLIFYPMWLLSGALTPPESMGPVMRYASLLSPVRHYVDFGYQVLFKGNGLTDVWPDIVGILLLGVALFAISVWRFGRLLR
jgi:ABC-2 type transport system permease protein